MVEHLIVVQDVASSNLVSHPDAGQGMRLDRLFRVCAAGGVSLGKRDVSLLT